MAKQVDTFSGSKSKVTIAKSGTEVRSAYPDYVTSLDAATTEGTIVIASADIAKTTSTPSLKKWEAAIVVKNADGNPVWEKCTDSIVVKAESAEIPAESGASGTIAIPAGQFAFFYKGYWYNPQNTAQFKEQNIYLRTAPYDASKKMLAMVVSSATDTDINSEAEVDEYSVLGEAGSRVSKGAVKTSGSISGKLDFGNNPSQKIMYKSIFEDENVYLSFYEFFYEDGGEIDINKCTVTEGEAIVTSFNITMSPNQAADFSCNYQFDGNPSFRDGSEII